MVDCVVMHQGDSFPIPIELMQDDQCLDVNTIEDLEICVGSKIKRKLSDGGILQADGSDYLYFVLSQAETLGMKPGYYGVGVRIKYPGIPPSVNIESIGSILIAPSNFKEEI